MDPSIRFFRELSARDVAIAGGKGANLGELMRKSVPVPDGFVILASCFGDFLRQSHLDEIFKTNLTTLNGEDVKVLESVSAMLISRIMESSITEEMQTHILRSFDQLGSRLVAVRSSATAEDGSDSAWAGQLDTYLGTTREKLVTNVKRCWASLFTSRALAYRYQNHLMESDITVAVVIQLMVASEVSGVAFSVHPVTQDPDQMIIEAGFGLGEAVVSGTITPDSWIIRKSDRKILETYHSEQEKGYFLNEQGGSEWTDLPAGQSAKAKLNPEEILELADLVIHIEAYFHFPCDIEWARKGKNWFILQCRPITTLGI